MERLLGHPEQLTALEIELVELAVLVHDLLCAKVSLELVGFVKYASSTVHLVVVHALGDDHNLRLIQDEVSKHAPILKRARHHRVLREAGA